MGSSKHDERAYPGREDHHADRGLTEVFGKMASMETSVALYYGRYKDGELDLHDAVAAALQAVTYELIKKREQPMPAAKRRRRNKKPSASEGGYSFQMECEMCAAVTIYENCPPSGADDLAIKDGWTQAKVVSDDMEVLRWRCPKHPADGKSDGT